MTFIVRDRDYDDCVSGINLDEVSSDSEVTTLSSGTFGCGQRHGDGARLLGSVNVIEDNLIIFSFLLGFNFFPSVEIAFVVICLTDHS